MQLLVYGWFTSIIKEPRCHVTGLNLSVFLLIGKTSALTMNVAGVVKDWLLIALSVAIYG